jgi:hypothetical protein
MENAKRTFWYGRSNNDLSGVMGTLSPDMSDKNDVCAFILRWGNEGDLWEIRRVETVWPNSYEVVQIETVRVIRHPSRQTLLLARVA